MATERLKAELQSLERKLILLINEHKNLKEQNQHLKAQNNALHDELNSRNEQVQNFQNQIKISKIAGSVGADRRDASELKSKIDEYIIEIDRCITHLSQ
jgi:chromosome segregation ATPase